MTKDHVLNDGTPGPRTNLPTIAEAPGLRIVGKPVVPVATYDPKTGARLDGGRERLTKPSQPAPSP